MIVQAAGQVAHTAEGAAAAAAVKDTVAGGH